MDTGGIGSRDTQQLIMICPGYARLREGKNMDDDKDLVNYLYDVIKTRMELDETNNSKHCLAAA